MNESLTLQAHPANPRARQRVLTGDDDGHAYRVVVPMRIRTVEAALDWLRPDDVPADALRQGEFYLMPSGGPHLMAGCEHDAATPAVREAILRGERDPRQTPCGSEEHTEAGSSYRWTVDDAASFSRTHEAESCWSVTKSGDVCFLGRKRVRSHGFTGRPTYYVRGYVEHAEHGRLELPAHYQGRWYEVVPNRAHGPFPVQGYGRGD
jgi:hypothetical protein